VADPKPIKMTVKFPSALPAYLDSEKSRDIVHRNIMRTMQGAVQIIHGEVVQNTPFSFGILRLSMTGEVLNDSNSIIGRISTPSIYGAAVEFGTRPHWVPIEPLKLWARRKLGDESIAYAVQRKIARVGTKGAFMFKRSFNNTKGRVRKLFANASAAMLRDLKGRK